MKILMYCKQKRNIPKSNFGLQATRYVFSDWLPHRVFKQKSLRLFSFNLFRVSYVLSTILTDTWNSIERLELQLTIVTALSLHNCQGATGIEGR